ncbi:MAG: hypothetical protein QNL01_08165 [Akkermansiaceae bacterium]|jgi:hypothetical protein
MDKKNKNSPRKAHDFNSQIEEEKLWDLEDDWDDADEAVSSDEPEEENAPVADENSSGEEDTEEVQAELDTPVEEVEEINKEKEEDDLPVEKAPLGNDDQFDLEDDKALDDEVLEIPDEADQDDSYDDFEDLAEDTDDASSSEELLEETEDDTEEPASDASKIGALVEPLKKLSLSSTEKIALSAIAAIFIGITIYGYIWLRGKNNDAVTADTLELPVEGKHATITEFTTFWKSPGKAPGIKLGAIVVPAASITLSDDSNTGALRIYFRNATQDSIGDPITISFQNGKFKNGTNSIEVSASDGFHLKGDFHAYQMDKSLAWKVDVLEASSSAATGSSYTILFDTPVAPTMR